MSGDHAAICRDVAVCRIDESSGAVETASVGNIDVQSCGPRSARRFGGSSAIVGGRGDRAVKPRTETTTVPAAELVILASDGISSKLSIEDDLTLLREHSIVIAQRIMDRFGRSNDDALVLVAR